LGIPDDVKEILKNHDWDDTIPRLLKFSKDRMKSLQLYGETGGDSAGGKSPKDFVAEAIKKTYLGDRKWDPVRVPDLRKFLFGVIRSDTNHFAESVENKRTRSTEKLASLAEEEGKHFVDTIQSSMPGPDEVLITEEQRKEDDVFFDDFIGYLDTEDDLIKVVECIMDGKNEPRKIAQELALEVSVVNNAKKKLGRRLNDFRQHRATQAESEKGGE